MQAIVDDNKDETKRKAFWDEKYGPFLKRREDGKVTNKASVDATQSSSFCATKIMPCIWPELQYTLVFGTPPEGSLKLHSLPDGERVWGVSRDDDGTPLRSGCYRLGQQLATGAEKRTRIASSENDVEASELLAAQRAAFAKTNVKMDATIKQDEDGYDIAAMTATEREEIEKQEKEQEEKSAKKRKLNKEESDSLSSVDMGLFLKGMSSSMPSSKVKRPSAKPKVKAGPTKSKASASAASETPLNLTNLTEVSQPVIVAVDAEPGSGTSDGAKRTASQAGLTQRMQAKKKNKLNAIERDCLQAQQKVDLLEDVATCRTVQWTDLEKSQDDIEKALDNKNEIWIFMKLPNSQSLTPEG